MKKNDFYFDLPESLIAQEPLENRVDSRLLVYSRHNQQIAHQQFSNLIDWLNPGDLLVMNNSKVIPARLYGQKSTGGQVELLVERILENNQFKAQIRASKAPKPGTLIDLGKGFSLQVLDKQDDLYLCQAMSDLDRLLHSQGHVPLPPYIRRSDTDFDLERYQTVYAKHKGSVAAPTAGLHFDADLLAALENKGILLDYVTLHVGAGTFQPVRVDSILDHKMHKEYIEVSASLCERVNAAKAQNRRVIAVGTTSLRCLETAARDGRLHPYNGDTDIFIYPGYSFKICDALLTNFHLPESTLLMLVAAFIGQAEAMDLYKLAIAEGYRFFSYGDASLLL